MFKRILIFLLFLLFAITDLKSQSSINVKMIFGFYDCQMIEDTCVKIPETNGVVLIRKDNMNVWVYKNDIVNLNDFIMPPNKTITISDESQALPYPPPVVRDYMGVYYETTDTMVSYITVNVLDSTNTLVPVKKWTLKNDREIIKPDTIKEHIESNKIIRTYIFTDCLEIEHEWILTYILENTAPIILQ